MRSETFPFLGRYHLGWAIFWALAMMLVFALATGMDEAIRNFPLTWMFPFGLAALFLGWFLSGLNRRPRILFISGLLIGLLLMIIINSGAYRNLFFTFVQIFRLDRLFEPFKRYPVNSELLIYFLQSTLINLYTIGEQIFTWFSNQINNNPSFDPKISEVFWGSALWSVSFSSGWLFRQKKHAFIASMPIMVLLIGILSYTRQNTTVLAIALFALLMMIVVLEHLRHENNWDLQKVDYSEALRLDITFLAIPIIFIILLAAIVLPNISFDAIKDFYDQIFLLEDHSQLDLERSLGLQKTPQMQPNQETSGVLPRELLIGSGPELSENLVMEIDTGEMFLPPGIDIDSTIPKYYWFGRSYDIYTGTGWLTSGISQRNYSKNEIIAPANLENSRLLKLKVRKTRSAQDTLYASGVPQSVDHKVTTAWREATNEYYSAQIDALTYQVTSPIMDVPEEELRRSTEPIPEEILNTYLQIPEETPVRVQDLAVGLTEDLHNSYDKAKAIEAYLRQFDYNLDVPKPDPNQDVVDFFLFDLQKGYCDYFASAMVILSRSIDIPARLAVGYTRGNYDFSRHVFVVSEANAHAWPEIYIAPYGWVPFEPTTSEIPFYWDAQKEMPGIIENGQSDFGGQINIFWLNLLILVGILSIIIMLGFLWYKFTSMKTKRTPANQEIETIYKRMKRLLSNNLVSSHPSRTPYEFQKDVVNYVDKQKSSNLKTRLMNPMTNKIKSITELYTQGIYSTLPISTNDVKIARKYLFELFIETIMLNFFLIFSRSKS